MVRFLGEQISSGERGRPARCFRRPAENLLIVSREGA